MIQYDSEMQLPGQAISVAPPSEWSLERVPVLYKNQYNTSPEELAREERAIRQRFMESTFKDDAASGAGTVGAYQIMPGVHGDYVARTGEKGDLKNYEYNKAVRDWYIDWLSQRGAISKGDPSENVRLARIYAAYNWGLGNLGKFLNAKREAGIDVDNSLDWIDMLPKETKNYVKFIVLGEDIGGTDRNSTTMNRLLGRDSSPVIPMTEKIPEGPLFYDNGGKLTKLIERINKTSNADFVKRLLDEKRKVLNNQDGTVSTHELGYVDDGKGNAIVFPSVQSSNGTLLRYPYPESLDRAIENGDTVHMSVPEAEMFTRGYKEYYPGFNEYGDGTGGKIGKFLRRMANAAVMNDPNSGAVAQASGYLLDPSGELTQNPEDEGAKQLSKNIAVLSAIPNVAVSSNVIPSAMAILANPTKASTDAGAAIATAVNAGGIMQSASNLGSKAAKALAGEYIVDDIPETVIDIPLFIPGTNLLASPIVANNIKITGNTLRTIPRITSRASLGNRMLHPVETYRFSDLVNRSNKVLPEEVHTQLLKDMKQTRFMNMPNPKDLDIPKGYSRFDRTKAVNAMGVDLDDMIVYGLGDPTRTEDFARAHELGHIADLVSAGKVGYISRNQPPIDYTYAFYNKIDDPIRVPQEWRADVFGNSLSDDMAMINGEHSLLNELHNVRYQKTKNVGPIKFEKLGY